MTTKDHSLPFKGKHGHSVIDDTSNGRYGNLNLNQKHQNLTVERVHSNNFSNQNKKVQNYALSKLSDLTQERSKSSISWKKSDNKLPSEYLNIHFGSDKNKSKEGKNSTKNKNSSTLSLHIAAYENYIEDSARDSFEVSRDKSNFNKNLNKVKHMALSSNINNPFEFPRQQTDESSDPAIMQFTASQKLLNPNQENGASVTADKATDSSVSPENQDHQPSIGPSNMSQLDNWDFDFITSEPSAIFDLSVLKNEFSHKILKHILDLHPNILNVNDLFDPSKATNESSFGNDNLSSGNVPLSQPLGIITDNIFDESDKDENKIDKIMRKLEEYYLLPVEFQDLPSDEIFDDKKPVVDVIDQLVIPDSLTVNNGFDWKNREQFIINQFPVLYEQDSEQQITAILKFIVQKIHEIKSKADAVCCEYGCEIPTSYAKLLSYVVGFFKYLPALPCISQVASFTIFKDLPIYFKKAVCPRRWLIIAPTSSRALKESILEMSPTHFFPGAEKCLEKFEAGLVVYFYNQELEIDDLLDYRWDCTIIFGEAKEKKPTDKAYDLLSKLENYQKDRFGFTVVLFEASENLWTKSISSGSSSIYKWFFPTFYDTAFFKYYDSTKIITQYFSSMIPFDEKQQTSEWLIKVLDLLVYKANNEQIFPFMILYNDAALDVSSEKMIKLVSQIRKQCNYTFLDNINVIFMNETESSMAATFFSKNGIPCCVGEDIPDHLRLFVISEVYNIEAMNVFVFAHFSIEIAGKIVAVMRRPSKYDKTIWFLQPKSHPIDMESFSTYFEVCREPFLNEEGRKTCMDEPTVLSKLKDERVEDLSKKFCSLRTSFNQELRTEAGGSERYANKFRKFLHIYQNARKQLEAEQRQQREIEAYQQDTEMEPPTPTSKQPRQTKKKPAPLKTQSSRQSIPKKPAVEPPKITYHTIHEKIRSYLPPAVGPATRLPFAPLQRTIIKKVVNEKQKLGKLDPIDEFNLCIAALKFQFFGNYFRNVEKNSEVYRAVSHCFNWDAVCIYFNYFLNCSNIYINKLNLNKKFFTRFFRKSLIFRTVGVDTDVIINRRQYEREFYEHLSRDDEKPPLSYNYRNLFERYRHHSQPISTAGISESSFNSLGKELSDSNEKDFYYTDLIDVVQNSLRDSVLPEDSFSDMLEADFDSILINDVTKKFPPTSPIEEFYRDYVNDIQNFNYDELLMSEYLSERENVKNQSIDSRANEFSMSSNIPASCQIILEYGDFIVDEPISPTEASECDNIKEEISYSKSLDDMDITVDATETLIPIGPTRRKIKNPEIVTNYNLSSEIMPMRISRYHELDKNPLPILFGSIYAKDVDDISAADEDDLEDDNSEYGSALSSDEENIDIMERKRKAPDAEEEPEISDDAKRRKILDESSLFVPESSGNGNNESKPVTPKFHLSPSEYSNSPTSSILQISPVEEEINFAVFHLFQERADRYFKICLPHLNSLDKTSKLSILQYSSIKNYIKFGNVERNFYEQPMLRKALSELSEKREANFKDAFEELINLNSVFSRESFDERGIAQQTTKKFTISFNDLLLRQYYERAIPITTSLQRYSYGDTSVMPAKNQILRRLQQQPSQQTPPTIQNQSRILSPMNAAASISRPVTPNIYRSPPPVVNVIPEHPQQQFQAQTPQQQFQRVVPANFSQQRQMFAQQNPMGGMLTPPHNQPLDNVILRPPTPQHQPLIRQPMQQQQQQQQIGIPGGAVAMVQAQIPQLGRLLTFPYEYHSNSQDKCECTNKDLGQPLYYNEEIPNYDDENIDPIIQLQKLSETVSFDSSITLLYHLCQTVPFEDSRLKDNQENGLATTKEFTPPIIPPLSLSRSNCLKKSRERFKSRQQIYVTLRGLGKSDIMNLLKQYEMKFNFPFNDFFTLKYRRAPAYDVRYLLNLWRTMSLSNKLRKGLNSQAMADSKKKFLLSMTSRPPLERSAEAENMNNGVNKIALKRCPSLPNLNTNKELLPSQIMSIKTGFKKAITFSAKNLSTSKFKFLPVIPQNEESVPQMPKVIPKLHRRKYHLGVSKMSFTINKRKVSTTSRFYSNRHHKNPGKIMPLYRRWKKPFHVEEYWKYTKDKREPPQAMFDMNLNNFF